jgi:type IV fimbrial biogenesis protein FimT
MARFFTAQAGRCHGFTLIELLITVAIVAILAGVAVPSMMSTVKNNRSTALVNELISALNFARSEAVKRGLRVNLCPRNAAGDACGADWSSGWLVQMPDGAVLQVWDDPGSSANVTTAPAVSLIAFGPMGQQLPDGTDIVISAAFDHCTGDQARSIRVWPVGHITTGRTACN